MFDRISPALRRHSRLFGFIGASLVFATYICKEVLLESQKSIVEEADSAQRTALFLKRLDLLTVRTTQIVAGVDLNVSGQKPSSWSTQAVRASRGSSDIATYLESLEELTHSVKMTSINRQRNEAIEKQVNDMESDLDKLLHSNESDSPESDSVEPIAKVLRKQLAIEVHIRSFSRALRKQLHNEKKEAEKTQKHITHWSYVLYCAGLLFGLLGQLLDVESARSGSE
jgi:hypothetical protein